MAKCITNKPKGNISFSSKGTNTNVSFSAKNVSANIDYSSKKIKKELCYEIILSGEVFDFDLDFDLA